MASTLKLAGFREAIVVVGGWVPDLLLPDAEPEHVGSIDVDLAISTFLYSIQSHVPSL